MTLILVTAFFTIILIVTIAYALKSSGGSISSKDTPSNSTQEFKLVTRLLNRFKRTTI